MQNRDIYDQAAALLREGRADVAAAKLQAWLEDRPDDEVGLSMLGSALMRSGDMERALTIFRRAAEHAPDSFAAQGDLGFGLMTAGDAGAAIAAFERAVALNDRFWQGWCHLGRLLYEAGRLDDARRAFACADACDPFAGEAAQIRQALNDARYAQAERIARTMLSRHAGHPKATLALAHLASRVGAFEEAAEILAAGIRHFPLEETLRYALVNSLEETGEYPRALEEAEALTRLTPQDAAAWQTKGRIHGHCGRYADALAAYDEALARAQDSVGRASAELLRGHMLKILGRFEECVNAYRASIAATAGNGAGWWALADLKVYRFDDADIAALRALAADERVRPAQRAQARFALGKALEERNAFDEAFDWYRQANATRPDVPFDPGEYHAGIDGIIAAFDTALLSRQASRHDGPVPIFIVGLPRSGSTLIEQILASHSLVDGTMELVTLPNVLRRMRIDGGRRGGAWPASLAAFDDDELAAYGQRYLDATSVYRTGKPYFIDKMPTNFDKVGLIHKILPRAIVIDARRHPLDCGLSCFRQHFASGHHFSYSLENIAHYYRGYLALMDHWDRVLPGKVLRVQYETLVGKTEKTVRTLLERCGLPFEDGCLRFYESARPVRTPSSEQVRRPVYGGGVGQWRRFGATLEPLSDALGPELLRRFETDA